MTDRDFEAFPSISRLSREVTIMEKIDGTNAQVYVPEDGGPVLAGSRNRWISPEDDNAGFARWVAEHAEELRTGLGPGRHFGEWWGQGIQRGYGLKEKRFSLFNVARWGEARDMVKYPGETPACCHVVPVLWRGAFHTDAVEAALADLADYGSKAAPGYMSPEGIVVFHEAARVLFKKTLGGDGHKGGRPA